jgi:putative flippase GtrA/GT2 family glycosyltransferase
VCRQLTPDVDGQGEDTLNGIPEAPVQVLSPSRPAGEAGGVTQLAATSSGEHAAALRRLVRRGARFVIFGAVGGTVFLMGLGLQAGLTGDEHLPPVASYLIQAVVSVQASFLLNRCVTWRDRRTPIRPALVRFNAQKTATIVLNLGLYAWLLRLGVNYLLANVVLTGLFTMVNYVAGDRFVFIAGGQSKVIRGGTRAAEPAATAGSAEVSRPFLPTVSVVIPCRHNERTIGAAVQSLLDQDYPALCEIILIGSLADRTWGGVAGSADDRLTMLEVQAPPGLRDANFKRDVGIRKADGDLIALVDSDVVLPPGWLSRAVTALQDSSVSCVAGGMASIRDDFWGRFTDSTWIGAKTPRIAASYLVTSSDFGLHGRKPPITANVLFTRNLYDDCPIDPLWSCGSYEDYEWFWRVARTGYGVLVCQDLVGWHHHRSGLRVQARDYRRSATGCAHFIRAHLDCPLAKRRLRQAVMLPLLATAAIGAAALGTAAGYGTAVAASALSLAAALAVHQVARSRRLEGLAYPAAGLALGLVFTTGLVTSLLRPGSAPPILPETLAPGPGPSLRLHPRHRRRRDPWRLLLHPLTAICAVQAALSLTLVWSNTAFGDEAAYLWIGRLEIAHWLHGTSWPAAYAGGLSGSAAIYPPLGALAAAAGGLASARILSLIFMIGATIALYRTTSHLFGRTAAIAASGLWVTTVPVLRLAFATYDPLSVFLTALSAWLAVQASVRFRRAEFVAASAVALALANAAALSGIVIDPVMIAFAFLIWLPGLGAKQARFCAGWYSGALLAGFGLVMTVTRSWLGTKALFDRIQGDHQAAALIANDIVKYSGVVGVLATASITIVIAREPRYRAWLLVLLGGAVFVVPLAQLQEHTAWSLDKHLAYGLWFAVIAAGYGISKLSQTVFTRHRLLAVCCCVIALAYPAVTSWQTAWAIFHSWPDSSAFVAAFRRAADQSRGPFFVPGDQVAEYYTTQGNDWTRWDDADLSLDPVGVKRSQWSAYYAAHLRSDHFGVIALFYVTSFTSNVRTPESILLSPRGRQQRDELLDIVAANSGEPGLAELTQAVEKDPGYRLAAVGPYDSGVSYNGYSYGLYAIWRQEAPR